MKIAFCRAEDTDGGKEVLYMLQDFFISPASISRETYGYLPLLILG